MKLYNKTIIATAVLGCLVAGANAAPGASTQIWSSEDPAKKPYQLVWVADTGNPDTSNSLYVAAFSPSETYGTDYTNQLTTAKNKPDNNSPDPNIYRNYWHYDIEGQGAFYQFKDANSVARFTAPTAEHLIPTCGDTGSHSDWREASFGYHKTFEHLDVNGDEDPKLENWNPTEFTSYLTQLHALDYNPASKLLVGGETFLGRIAWLNLGDATPTVYNTSGTALRLHSDIPGEEPLLRNRLVKFTPDGLNILFAERTEEENPNEPEFNGKLLKFKPADLTQCVSIGDGTAGSGPGVAGPETNGHSIYSSNTGDVWTGGIKTGAKAGFYKTPAGYAPNNSVLYRFEAATLTELPTDFSALNLLVDGNYLYALNSVDFGTGSGTPKDWENKTWREYLTAWRADATANERGLYVFEINDSNQTLKKVAYEPLTQPVELVKDGNDLYVNDRIEERIVKIDVTNPSRPVANLNFAQTPDCPNSNITLADTPSGKKLFATAVWGYELVAIGSRRTDDNKGSYHACNAVYRIDLD